MKYLATCLVALVLLFCFSGLGFAHRVNVFAFVDGDAIQVECSFSKSQKVKNGKLVISDLETDGKLFEGTTDEQGVFRFKPDAGFLKTGHGLNILLIAGEGHQNDWQISAEELAALSPSGQPAKSVAEQSTPAEQVFPAVRETREQLIASLDAAELEALIGKVLDAKLAPIKQTLARQEDGPPNARDIIGGIGWILGLLGVATYLKYKRLNYKRGRIG